LQHGRDTRPRALWITWREAVNLTVVPPYFPPMQHEPARVDYFNAGATRLSAARLAPDFQQPFVTYDENALIWAEAAYRTGDQATALTKLNEERANHCLAADVVAGLALLYYDPNERLTNTNIPPAGQGFNGSRNPDDPPNAVSDGTGQVCLADSARHQAFDNCLRVRFAVLAVRTRTSGTIRLSLNDAGRAETLAPFGKQVTSVEGEVRSVTDSAITIAVSEVSRASSEIEQSHGEAMTIPSRYIGVIERKHVQVARSLALQEQSSPARSG
jgi:hypothetical protein